MFQRLSKKLMKHFGGHMPIQEEEFHTLFHEHIMYLCKQDLEHFKQHRVTLYDCDLYTFLTLHHENKQSIVDLILYMYMITHKKHECMFYEYVYQYLSNKFDKENKKKYIIQKYDEELLKA